METESPVIVGVNGFVGGVAPLMTNTASVLRLRCRTRGGLGDQFDLLLSEDVVEALAEELVRHLQARRSR
jgi:hypothetical protein